MKLEVEVEGALFFFFFLPVHGLILRSGKLRSANFFSEFNHFASPFGSDYSLQRSCIILPVFSEFEIKFYGSPDFYVSEIFIP